MIGLLRAMLASLLLLVAAALPAAAPPDLSVYGQLPGFEMASLSPSGDKVALIGTIGANRSLLVLDKAGKPVFAAPVDTMKVRGLNWAGEDRVLVFSSVTASLSIEFTASKAELMSVLVLPIDGGAPWTIFQGKRTVTGGVRGIYGIRERGGRWFGYFGGMTLDQTHSGLDLRSTKPALYEVDLASQDIRRIAPRAEDGSYRDWIVDADGNVAATLDYQSSSGAWAIRNASSQRIAGGVSKLSGVSLAGLGRSPGTLIYRQTAEEDGESRWFEMPLAGGPAVEILEKTEVSRLFFDTRRRQLLGYAKAGDMPSYHFFGAQQQKVVNGTLKAFPGLVVQMIDWNDRFDRLIVRTDGGTEAQDWWLVDIAKRDAAPLGRSYLVPAGQVGPVRIVRYKASDGQEMAGVLTLPPGRPAKQLPVIILPHGGPAAHDVLGFDWWAQAFAARGYAVFQPNFRGSTGYGAAFRRAGRGEWGRRMQTDLSDGLAYLAQEGIADPKRACIMGASYGGYAALAGVTLQQGIYRCAVSVAGVSDLARMVNGDIRQSGGDPTLRRALRDELGSGRDLAAVSPLRLADQVTAPVLLVHGKDDTVVLPDQSRSMADALRRAGKVVDYVQLAGEDHWLSRGDTRLAMLTATVAFVEKHNPPDPGS